MQTNIVSLCFIWDHTIYGPQKLNLNNLFVYITKSSVTLIWMQVVHSNWMQQCGGWDLVNNGRTPKGEREQEERTQGSNMKN